MARKKENVRTRRMQYDELLSAAYKTNCRSVAIVGFEFGSKSEQEQYHYGLLYESDKYLFYDGVGCRANVAYRKENADAIRAIAGTFGGREVKVALDEEI